LSGYLLIQLAVSVVWQLAGLAIVIPRQIGTVAGIALYAAVLIGCTLAFVGTARSIARSRRRVPPWIARGLRSNAGIVALTLLAMATTMLVSYAGSVFLARLLDSSSLFGVMSGAGPDPTTTMVGSTLMWSLPFVALACLLWHERGRTLRESGVAARE
jgi:hypothetical protein